jgi:hypothetical protein
MGLVKMEYALRKCWTFVLQGSRFVARQLLVSLCQRLPLFTDQRRVQQRQPKLGFP